LAALLAGPKTQSEVSALFKGNKTAEQLATLRAGLLKAGRITLGSASPNGRTIEIWNRKT
jgi:hypothetical protein